MKKLNSLGIAHLLIPLIVVVVGVAAVGTYMLVASHAGRPCVNRDIGPGSKGGCTQAVQRIVGAKPDGNFGSDTKKRVQIMQEVNGLKPDGIVGKRTWNMLCHSAADYIHGKGNNAKGVAITKKAFKQASCSMTF